MGRNYDDVSATTKRGEVYMLSTLDYIPTLLLNIKTS